MPGARCTRSLVCRKVNTRVSHHGRTGNTRHSRTRMVLTAYFVLSPVIGLSCHRRPADMVLSAPGRADLASAGLDAGVEASGPHDFAVRESIVRQLAVDRSRKNPPCDHASCPTLPRPSHPVPNVRDDRETPLQRAGMAGDIDLIWVWREGKYFWRWDWTGGIRLIRLNKFAAARKSLKRGDPP